MHEHHRDRLREKVFIAPEALNEYELLEVVLFNAIPRKNTNDISHRLIDTFGSIFAVFNANPAALAEVEGVGKNTAAYLCMLGEIMRRKKMEDAGRSLFNPNCSREELLKAFSFLEKEMLVVFFLDAKRKITCKKIISSNSANTVRLDLADLSRQLVLLKPSSVALVHNHPEGAAVPSEDDDNATEKVCVLLGMNDIDFADHLIISKNDVFSYYYSGRLESIRRSVEAKFR